MGDTNAQRALLEGKNAFNAGKPLEAARYFQAATLAEPHNEAAWKYLGYALNAGAQPQEAVAAFEKAQHLDQNDSEAHFGLALACIALGDDSRAVVEFEKTLKLRPDHPALHTHFLGTLLRHSKRLLDQGNVEWSRKYLDRAFELDETDANVILARLHFAQATDNRSLAVETIHHLEEHKPDFPDLVRLKDEYGLLKQKERGWLY